MTVNACDVPLKAIRQMRLRFKRKTIGIEAKQLAVDRRFSRFYSQDHGSGVLTTNRGGPSPR